MELRGWTAGEIAYFLLGAFALALPFSIALAEPLAFGVLPFWLYDQVSRKTLRQVTAYPAFIPLILFCALAVASAFYGIRPGVSLGKCHRLILLSLVFMVGTVGQDRLLVLAKLFLTGTSIRAGYDLLRVPMAVFFGGQDVYSTGGMRDPQMYLVALCLVLGLILAGKDGWRSWWSVALLNGLGIVLHFKRGVWAAFYGVILLLAATRRRWVLLLALLLLSGAMFLVPAVRARVASLPNEFALEQGGRYVLWTQAAPALLMKYPFGMGYRGMRHEDLVPYAFYVQPKLNHLHNNMLQVAVEVGWLGLAVWLVWMGTAGFWAWRVCRLKPESGLALGALVGFCGLMLNGLVECNFGDGEVFMLLCFVMGLTYGVGVEVKTITE